MRTWEHYPKEAICPICGTNEDKECCLMPIDGTDEDNICQAQPVHTACLLTGGYRINKSVGIIYFSVEHLQNQQNMV